MTRLLRACGDRTYFQLGARKVEGARIGLANVPGFDGASGVHILERA